jgi:phosphatidylserine/phosphatidylglycerophosphate/cardiolipin synthase-like enzyme
MAASDLAALARRLGALLTATEARGIANRLADGDTLSVALRVVSPTHRAEVRTLLETVAVAESAAGVACTLYAIEGARSTVTHLEPLWTMPGHLAQGGPLTSSAPHLVDNARTSVTCSTYNFQKSSAMWDALARAAERPEMALRVYVDTHAADREPNGWTPTTTELAAHLYPAVVLRTKSFDGGYVRNHAKFLAVDHRFLLVTSANFSWSAEQGNVEFGILIDNPNLTEAVERELRDAEDALYERVVGHR